MVSLGLCFLMLLTIFFVLNYEGYYGRVPLPVLYIVLPFLFMFPVEKTVAKK